MNYYFSHISNSKKRRHTLEYIARIIFEKTGVKPEQLKYKIRNTELVDARTLLYMRGTHLRYTVRELANFTQHSESSVRHALRSSSKIKQVQNLYNQVFND